MWPRASKPSVWQACPACGSLNGLEGQPIIACVDGEPVRRGRCVRCVDCGETFYALKSGEVKLTLQGKPREVAHVATPAGPAPLSVVHGGQSRYPAGMEGLNMAPPEPEQ